MDVLSLFHPLVREWFTGRFGSPTRVQERAWEAIAGGRHVLITAPTGSGKTLAAFLWALDGLITGRQQTGKLRVLYVSPLKALNNDVQKNLAAPLAELEALFRERGVKLPKIRALTRSGDTPESERRAMRAHPPEILITTPESLNILLTSPQASLLFDSLSTVILDEIHAVVESKRGTHLIAGVERLTRYAGEFQRVSLSATVKPLELVAAFTAGFTHTGGEYRARPVEIVEERGRKRYDLAVTAPFQAGGEGEETWWSPLVELCRAVIEKNRSTLFFVNSRKKTEKLARLINETGPDTLAYSHHGALSREIRLSVEEQLKSGRLKAIVATGTLELGIDIGELDEVVLVQSSASVSQAVQRIGRAGHQVEGLSRGRLVPLSGIDLVHLGALSKAVSDHAIESIRPLEAPLDVLAQVVLSMTSVEIWKADKLYSFIKTMYPYRALSRERFDLVVGMLAGRYEETNIRELSPRVVVDSTDGTITARKGARLLLYLSGGTIPDRGYYELKNSETGARVGELDEEFVWERNVGDTFVFGLGTWRIQRITQNAVEAEPRREGMAMAPFYRAEEQNRSFHFSELIGEFLEQANLALGREQLFGELMRKAYRFDDEAIEALASYLRAQTEITKVPLPHRLHIVIEHCQVPLSEGQIGIVIVHTFWGGRVNKPLADAFAFLWEDTYHYPLEHYANNDTILFHLPHEFSAAIFRDILCSPELFPALLTRITQTNAFGALFRENAGRSLLLPKPRPGRRMPFWLTRLRSKNLLAAVLRFPDFPLLLETAANLREAYYDLESAARVVEEIRSGAIAISETRTGRPSPFADEIVWRMTNRFMYEGDELKASQAGPWRTEESLLFDPRLLTAVSPALAAELERKLKRTAPGYAPGDMPEFFLLVQERLAVPEPEWHALIEAVERDHGFSFAEIISPQRDKFAVVRMPRARIDLVLLFESIPILCRSFGLDPEKAGLRDLDGRPIPVAELSVRLRRLKSGGRHGDDAEEKAEKAEESETMVSEFLGRILRFFGPLPESLLRDLFGLEESVLQESLNALLRDEKIVYGRLLEGDTYLCLCDRENYNRLLHMKRRARRKAAPLLDLDLLPLFFATRQNLVSPAAGDEALPRALESLLGWPAPAASWEEHLLPARVSAYDPTALDSLLSRTNLVWTGAGKGKIIFSFPDDLALFRAEKNASEESIATIFPNERGRYALEDLVAMAKENPSSLQEKLWRGVWEGAVSNTAFETLRRALVLDFAFASSEKSGKTDIRRKPNLHSRWTTKLASAGFWYALPGSNDKPIDPVEALETDKERVRLLLERYGCLFRELLAHETPAFWWKRLFGALRLMELSGEIVGGSFFRGMQGIQFMSEEALVQAEVGLDENAVFWMNAGDPASPCGKRIVALKGEYPDRLPSTWLVFHGRRLVMVLKKNGAELEFRVEAAHPLLSRFGGVFDFLISRAANPFKYIKTAKINNVEAIKSPFRETLEGMGFKEEYRSLVLRKQY
ncbi:MAG: DEAD/DEAH box helicase [Spirochaetales bacterium]|nr:DEAD/DEAH box helicase [Spirochaetales bacterium]